MSLRRAAARPGLGSGCAGADRDSESECETVRGVITDVLMTPPSRNRRLVFDADPGPGGMFGPNSPDSDEGLDMH